MIQITDMRVHPGDSAFLIDDGKTAILYDSGFGFTGEQLAQKLRRHLGARELAFIFLTHSHYDHAYGAAYVKREFPAARICAGEYAAKIFQKPGAKPPCGIWTPKWPAPAAHSATVTCWTSCRWTFLCRTGR
jgi:glyoxylase-like metal-dependent hydrolase (beta-lactamase superfamily II)